RPVEGEIVRAEAARDVGEERAEIEHPGEAVHRGRRRHCLLLSIAVWSPPSRTCMARAAFRELPKGSRSLLLRIDSVLHVAIFHVLDSSRHSTSGPGARPELMPGHDTRELRTRDVRNFLRDALPLPRLGGAVARRDLCRRSLATFEPGVLERLPQSI